MVRDHHQLVFISQNGMVQRIAVRDIRPLGRNAQGFRLMNIREDDQVSAVALVMEEEASTAASAETLDPETVAGPADDPALAEDADVLEEAGPADPTDDGDDHAARGRRGRRRAVGAHPSARPRRSVLWRYQRKGVVRS